METFNYKIQFHAFNYSDSLTGKIRKRQIFGMENLPSEIRSSNVNVWNARITFREDIFYVQIITHISQLH